MAVTKRQREGKVTAGERERARRASATKAATRPIPKVPAGLGPVGKDIWQRTWRTAPWLDVQHEVIVQRLCEAYDERDELRKEIKKTGRLSIGSTGQPVESPLLSTLRACEVGINRIERQIGLTVTASRSAAVIDDVAAEANRPGTVGTRLSELK